MGITTTSLGDIRDDLDLTISENTINKILRSLRDKSQIDFENRQGRRGSFPIWMGYWLLPKQNYREVPDCNPKTPALLETVEEKMLSEEEEVRPKLSAAIPNFDEMKSQIAKGYSISEPSTSFLSPYNDKDTERDTKTLSVSSNGRTFTGAFQPKSLEEAAVRRIALAVGDPHINPLLAVLNVHGLRVIEQAYEELQRRKNSGAPLDNPGGYLMGIIKKKTSKK
ncbi:MAG: hypothetical protein V4681_01340 [Patescibacteria group bacterium]